MQPVQKKKRRKKKPWLVFILLGIILAALTLLLILTTKPQDIPVVPDNTDESLTLIQKNADDLTRIEVFPSMGEGFTLIRSGDVFMVEGMPDFALEAREIDLMVKDLSLLTAHEVMGQLDPGDTDSLSALGLGDDAARVWAIYRNGGRIGLAFGNTAATEIPADYLMLTGDNRVFTVSQETRAHFDRTLFTLHPVPALNFSSDLLDEAVFEGAGAFTLTLKEGLWELTSPGRYPADEAAVKAFLNNVNRMRLAVYAGEASEDNISLYGFATENRSVTFRLAKSAITAYDEEGLPLESRAVEAQDLTLSFGKEIDRIGFYIRYGDGIYQASLASMGFLRNAAWAGLHARAPVNVPVNRLETLSAQKAAGTNTYAISLVESVLPNNQLELDMDGNRLYLPEIIKNGTEMDRDAFLREYLKLMALTASGSLPPDFEPDGDMAARYRLTGAGIDLDIALYPFDALHYAMRVNGIFADYTDRQAADAIQL